MLNRNAILKEMSEGRIIIEPFDIKQLGENSYNLRLGNSLGLLEANCTPDVLTHDKLFVHEGIDPKLPPKYVEHHIPEEGFWILPGKMYLGYTIERAGSKDPFVPMLEGRSSFGRLDLVPHKEAGFGDIGFGGHWTLEISTGGIPFKLYPGMQICQVFFERCEGEPLMIDYSKRGNYTQPEPKWMPSMWFIHQDK